MFKYVIKKNMEVVFSSNFQYNTYKEALDVAMAHLEAWESINNDYAQFEIISKEDN